MYHVREIRQRNCGEERLIVARVDGVSCPYEGRNSPLIAQYLISRYRGIDFAGPCVDSPAQGLRLVETLTPKPDGNIHRTDTGVAIGHDMHFRVEFLEGPGSNLPHRDVLRRRRSSPSPLPTAPAHRAGRAQRRRTEAGSRAGGRDFKFKHISIGYIARIRARAQPQKAANLSFSRRTAPKKTASWHNFQPLSSVRLDSLCTSWGGFGKWGGKCQRRVEDS